MCVYHCSSSARCFYWFLNNLKATSKQLFREELNPLNTLQRLEAFSVCPSELTPSDLQCVAWVPPSLSLWQWRSGFVDRTRVLLLSDEHVHKQALNFAPCVLWHALENSCSHSLSQAFHAANNLRRVGWRNPSCALRGILVRSSLAMTESILWSVLINTGLF